MNVNLMLLRLYAIPLLCLISSLIMVLISASLIPESPVRGDGHAMSWSNMFFSQFSYFLLKGLRWISLGLFITALITALYITWDVRQRDICPHCGGIVSSPKFGRYGPYVKCFACGKNISLR